MSPQSPWSALVDVCILVVMAVFSIMKVAEPAAWTLLGTIVSGRFGVSMGKQLMSAAQKTSGPGGDGGPSGGPGAGGGSTSYGSAPSSPASPSKHPSSGSSTLRARLVEAVSVPSITHKLVLVVGVCLLCVLTFVRGPW